MPRIKLAQPKDRFGLGSNWLSPRNRFDHGSNWLSPRNRFDHGSNWLSPRTDLTSDQTVSARGQILPWIKLVQPEDRFCFRSNWLCPRTDFASDQTGSTQGQILPRTKLAQPPILSFLTTAGTLHRPQSAVRKKTLVILIPTLHVCLLSETFPQTLP